MWKWAQKGPKRAFPGYVEVKNQGHSPWSLRSCWWSNSRDSSSRLTLHSLSWAWISPRLCSACSLPAAALRTSTQLCSSSCWRCLSLLSSENDVQGQSETQTLLHMDFLAIRMWVLWELTLFSEFRQCYFDEFRGSFQLLCELVSLFVNQMQFHLELCDAATNKQDKLMGEAATHSITKHKQKPLRIQNILEELSLSLNCDVAPDLCVYHSLVLSGCFSACWTFCRAFFLIIKPEKKLHTLNRHTIYNECQFARCTLDSLHSPFSKRKPLRERVEPRYGRIHICHLAFKCLAEPEEKAACPNAT